MLLSVPNRLVLLPNTELRRLTNVLGVQLVREFKDYAVVPHRVDTSIVLKNLGYDVPAPIYSYYDWPIRHPHAPMDHQKITSAFLTTNKRAFCLNDMGTGKTLSAYWAADFLMREGVIRRCLVISPLSTLERVHGDTIYQTFVGDHQRTFTILHGTRQTRERLLKHDFDFYVINHDGVEVIQKVIAERKDLDLIILDEGAVYRNQATNRWKTLKSLIKPQMWVWELTGAPTPNEPTDAYAQIKLVRPEAIDGRYRSFRSFKMATMDQINMFRWEAKDNAMQTVYSAMQPSIRFSRDECLDLPECTTTTLDVPLTVDQTVAYKSLMKSLMADVNNGKVTALNEAVKVMRLIQVSSGVVYDQEGVHQHIDCGPRLAVLKELIEEAPAKVIVFVPYKGNIAFLENRLKGITVATVNGDTPIAKRTEIFKSFQHSETPRVLVAHPACMAHGLTLTQAATVVWWAPGDSNEDYEQANDRINRIGQKRRMSIYHLAGSAAERKRYRQLEKKQKLQGILLELVEESKRVDK